MHYIVRREHSNFNSTFMKTNFLKIAVLSSVLFVSCLEPDGDSSNTNPEPTPSTFIDHGYIPASVKSDNSGSEFQSAIYSNGAVYVATNDGIWKNTLATKEWSRAGLEGKVITCIYKHPTIPNKFFAGTKSDGSATDKTLYLTIDAGVTWLAVAAPIFDMANNRYENYVCMAVRPNNPRHIYANLEGGTTIAVSTDDGANWVRMNNQTSSNFGYQSNIVFIANNSNKIFQGSETPLDDAWLGRYDVGTTPTDLTNFEKVVTTATWGNRRPTELQAYNFVPNTIYVGQEGALSKVTGTTSKDIFKVLNGATNFPYSYIYGIWVNPSNPNHIIFGGSVNGSDQPMSLYETYNEGGTIRRIENKLGLQNPQVREILQTNTYPAILLNDADANKVKLVLYRP